MEENAGKLGIMDFFNVILTGGLFTICTSWIYPVFWDLYTNITKEYQKESWVGIIIIFFGIGLILQEVGSYYDSRFEHIKDNVLNNFLKEELSLEKGLIGRIFGVIEHGLKIIKKIFKKEPEKIENKIINNAIKLKIYIKHGEKILEKKVHRFSNKFSSEECRFIYAYCLYYVENKGKHAKYEKMRGLFDLARTMISSSLLLLLESCILMIYNIWKVKDWYVEKENLIQIILFAFCTIIFYGRAKRIMNYKARMLMEVYDICVDVNEEQNRKI